MHVLIIGSRGQLGRALCETFQSRNATRISAWSRPAHDVALPAISEQIAELGPDVVINAAAWTDVDGAESHPDAAYAANALGPHYIAEGCLRCGASMVQVSTNEVFPGTPGHFYREYDMPAPGGVYARSKLAGERAAQSRYDRVYVVRTAWVFGSGENDFPTKIQAAADKYGALRVVNDEFGNPSYAPHIARAIGQLVETERYGTYHLVNSGRVSRCDFARAVLDASGRSNVPITPIAHTEWPRPAPPPLHAVLVNSAAKALGIELPSWHSALDEYVTAVQTPTGEQS